jgi:hypothetical protein
VLIEQDQTGRWSGSHGYFPFRLGAV